MTCTAVLRVITTLAVFVTSGNAASAHLRKTDAGTLAVQQRAAAPQHRLRVCNAYPYQTSLNVYVGDTQITEPAMAYKECRQFEPQLHAGDRIDFRFLEASAGTFVVKDLPAVDAILMLVIYRHSVETTSVAFESHVFANLLNAQIAVLDTYRGPEKGELKIQDLQEADTSRSEKMTPNTVVAVNAGKYEVVLVGADGKTTARSDLTIENRESSVVIRCGVQPVKGRAYPEELIVYPSSPPPGITSKEHWRPDRPGANTKKMEQQLDRRAHLPGSAPMASIAAIAFGVIVVSAFAVFALW